MNENISDNVIKKVCSVCGSENVANRRYVNVNTNEIYETGIGNIHWCFDCDDTTKIVRADHLTKKPTNHDT